MLAYLVESDYRIRLLFLTPQSSPSQPKIMINQCSEHCNEAFKVAMSMVMCVRLCHKLQYLQTNSVYKL